MFDSFMGVNTMKRYFGMVGILLSLAPGLFGQELSGEDIIKKVDENMNVDSSFAKAKMTITTSAGKERTFVYESWSKNKGEKNLVRYIEPRRVKGQATLMLNFADDIWMYFPRTQRVRKLATHAKKQKMEGSDFSYEDMGGGNAFVDDFITQRLPDEKIEGEDCYKLELTRKESADSSYSRLIIWVIQENYVPLVIGYFSEKDPDKELKRLVCSDIQLIDDIPTATKLVMLNRNDNTQTIMELQEIKYHLTLEDTMFSQRELKK